MFDVHLHLPSQCLQLNHMPQTWRGLVCTSRTEEWQELIAIAKNRANMTGAIGILPEALAEGAFDGSLAEMELTLKSDEALQIGEVGLDRRFQDKTPLKQQMEFLSEVLELGWQMDRSVSLHVVGAEEPLFKTLERHSGKLPRLLWHGFTASIEAARHFTGLGGTISLGPSLWRPGLRLAGRLPELRNYPFAVETDWPEGWLPEGWKSEMYQTILSRHLDRLATAMDIPVNELEERTHAIGTLFTYQQASR